MHCTAAGLPCRRLLAAPLHPWVHPSNTCKPSAVPITCVMFQLVCFPEHALLVAAMSAQVQQIQIAGTACPPIHSCPAHDCLSATSPSIRSAIVLWTSCGRWSSAWLADPPARFAFALLAAALACTISCDSQSHMPGQHPVGTRACCMQALRGLPNHRRAANDGSRRAPPV